jgi:hypothetical protein
MKLEAFLARIYTDAALRRSFLEHPRDVALACGVSEGEAESLASVDRDGVELAAASFERKRKSR